MWVTFLIEKSLVEAVACGPQTTGGTGGPQTTDRNRFYGCLVRTGLILLSLSRWKAFPLLGSKPVPASTRVGSCQSHLKSFRLFFLMNMLGKWRSGGTRPDICHLAIAWSTRVPLSNRLPHSTLLVMHVLTVWKAFWWMRSCRLWFWRAKPDPTSISSSSRRFSSSCMAWS